MEFRSVLVAGAVAVLLAAPPAAAEDCDPDVERALVENAKRGAEDDLVVVRHPEAGIRNPDSIFDFSCVTDMFNYRHSQILFDPGRAVSDILGLLRRQICAAAREAYRDYLGGGLDASLLGLGRPRLPGLSLDRERGNLLRDAERERARQGGRDAELPAPGYRAAPPARAPAGERSPPSPARPSGADLFRDAIGGGG